MRRLIWTSLVVALFVAGCSTQRSPRSQDSPRTLDSFRFIGATTTIQDVTTRFGSPDLDIGYGQHSYGYRLSDGSFVLVGFVDPAQVLSVRHGEQILFERK
jgi:hypothetical protein